MYWITAASCLVAALLFLTFVFVIARIKNRYDLIDVAWGLTFIAIAVVSFVAQPEMQFNSVQTLVTILVLLWGLRLSAHINYRFENSKHEDPRYQVMRKLYAKKVGGVTLNMYGRVFVVQAMLAVVVSASVIVVNVSEPVIPSYLAFIGGAVWLIGFLFEAVGDKQLENHLDDPAKKDTLMTTGVWKYTRHPNYFGEATQWWGIWVIALSVPFGWVSIVAPLVITVLLLFISGVPLTEKRFEGRAGWSKYKKHTSIFFPLPPKK